MHIHLITVGQRPPLWIQNGYEDYAKRLPPECTLVLHEVPLGRRSKGQDTTRAIHDEGTRILAAIPRHADVIALDIQGRALSTPQLTDTLKQWLQNGQDLALLVGGPDGLAPQCLTRAQWRWSLSPLTLPHALVRVLLAEQIYRAWSVLQGHPYHRG